MVNTAARIEIIANEDESWSWAYYGNRGSELCRSSQSYASQHAAIAALVLVRSGIRHAKAQRVNKKQPKTIRPLKEGPIEITDADMEKPTNQLPPVGKTL